MPENYLQTITFGDVQVTMMTLAWLRWDFTTSMTAPSEVLLARYAHLFEQPATIPVRCMHIQLPGMSVLVDACTSDAFKGTAYERPGDPIAPNLLDQLALAGISAGDITHVVITHHHFDHIIGLTMKHEDAFVPCFPHARHYLGRADWDAADVQNDLAQPGALFHRTLGVVEQCGLLERVDGDRELGHGLNILHMPGETPGHQVLRLNAGGQILYFIGDLYHHQVEIEQPAWMIPWADSSTLLQSRQRFRHMALTEDALLAAAHIPDAGRMRATSEGGTRWEAWKP